MTIASRRIQGFIIERSGGKPNDALLTHCHRELFHVQWHMLLDDEFLEAYEHGIVITCQDKVVLIATIRNLGKCPCPRCLIPKSRVHLLATRLDILERETLSRSDTAQCRAKVISAHKLIYESNYAVDGTCVEELLKDESLIPTLNAFSEKLGHTGFDLFLMLVTDLLHEFELGVWKAIFIHLLRILESVKQSIPELDKQYCQVPTFGRDTIRRFRENCSELKKMTARGFEDLLQCALPVFENLLPEPHNSHVQCLLFYLCHWHALAKLRMHMDYTLDIMEHSTVHLAKQIHKFSAETCPVFATKELRRKAESRTRQGELEHRVGKSRFTRTSRKAYIPQLASMEHRQERIHHIKARVAALHTYSQDPVPNRPDVHHVIGQSQNFSINILSFQMQNSDDPTVKNFIPKLKAHLLPHVKILHSDTQDCLLTYNEDHISEADLGQVVLKGERIYRHNLFRINYTTYDVRRAQDSVNPLTDHRNIVLLSPEPSVHPFCYARVLGIYHANVIYIGPGSKDYQSR
ncbi:hypothetical protein BDN67DRAFT_992676 [Paxillus ammoniavirescens]|nr:hypothetical protein BDN67DRAFT_992676 [Paxillus ammoniavirescens]